MFKGSRTRWIQFANSLKMRILIRQSRIPGRDAYIIAEINKCAAIAEGFMTTVEAGFEPGYLPSTGKANAIYDKWGYQPSGATRPLGRFPRASKFLIDTYKLTGGSARMKKVCYAIGGG